MSKLAGRFKRNLRRLELLAGWLQRDFAWYLHGRSYFSAHADCAGRNRKWVFLVGCNNSGTTILHDLLASTGEFTALRHEGQRYTRQLVLAERRGFERVWTEYLADLRMTESDSTAIAPRLMHDWLFDAVPKERDLVLEKTTANAVRMRWLQKAIPNSYFIGIIRNGLAVAEGIRRKGRKDIARAARHWSKVNEIMRSDGQSVSNYLELRYEYIVDAPGQVVAEVSEFLGRSAQPLAPSLPADHFVDMNPRSLDRLTADDRKTVLEVAGPMLRTLGYVR